MIPCWRAWKLFRHHTRQSRWILLFLLHLALYFNARRFQNYTTLSKNMSTWSVWVIWRPRLKVRYHFVIGAIPSNQTGTLWRCAAGWFQQILELIQLLHNECLGLVRVQWIFAEWERCFWWGSVWSRHGPLLLMLCNHLNVLPRDFKCVPGNYKLYKVLQRWIHLTGGLCSWWKHSGISVTGGFFLNSASFFTQLSEQKLNSLENVM